MSKLPLTCKNFRIWGSGRNTAPGKDTKRQECGNCGEALDLHTPENSETVDERLDRITAERDQALAKLRDSVRCTRCATTQPTSGRR